MKRDERVVRSMSLPLPYRKHMQNAYGLTSAQVHRTRPTQMPKRNDFTILAILGRSGMGKTASLRNIQPDESKWINNIRWKPNLPVVMQVHSNPEEAGKLLNAVGLRSMPVWLLPYKDLSTGQQARAHMTRALIGDNVSVIDEFGSTIDPLTRQCMAFTFQKAVRARNRKVVVAVNDERILPFLKPDRVFDANSGEWLSSFAGAKVPINVTLHLINGAEAMHLWRRMRYEHYLSHALIKNCIAFSITLSSPNLPRMDQPVGIIVINCLAGWQTIPAQRDVRYVHRLVIDPAVQGLHVGGAAIDLAGAVCKKRHLTLKCITSHSSMISHLNRSPLWNNTGQHTTQKWHENNPDRATRNVETYGFVGYASARAPQLSEVQCKGCPQKEKFDISVKYVI